MKDADPPADLHFTLESVQLRGEAKSAVLRGADAPERIVKHTAQQSLALQTYQEAAREKPVTTNEGAIFRGVHVDDWREAFYRKHTGDNPEAKKKAFQRVRSDLVAMGTMTVQDDVYLVADPAIQIAAWTA